MSLTTLLGSTFAFFLLHPVILKATGYPFHVALKLSRGLASIFLVAAGIFSLHRFFSLWPQAFLIQQPGVSLSSHIVSAVCGHLIADLIWLGYGVGVGERARRDLALHHLLGLLACALAFSVEAGYALIAVALTSEVLPVTTGLAGLGEALAQRRWRILAAWSGFLVILAWRLPCWIFFLFRTVSNLRTGKIIESLAWVYPICLAVAAAVIVLDLYWCRLYLRALGRLAQI